MNFEFFKVIGTSRNDIEIGVGITLVPSKKRTVLFADGPCYLQFPDLVFIVTFQRPNGWNIFSFYRLNVLTTDGFALDLPNTEIDGDVCLDDFRSENVNPQIICEKAIENFWLSEFDEYFDEEVIAILNCKNQIYLPCYEKITLEELMQ